MAIKRQRGFRHTNEFRRSFFLFLGEDERREIYVRFLSIFELMLVLIQLVRV